MMIISWPCAALLLLGLRPGMAAPPAPEPTSEQLTYNVNWPSGLSLGEAHLQASRNPVGDRWDLELTIDAAIPAFAVRDRFHSTTGADYASREFQKDSMHGPRIAKETITFDPPNGTATRATNPDGGKSDLSLAPGTRDALAFLYYLRKELSQGRVPSSQTVVFGAPYQVRLEYTGGQTVKVDEKGVEADGLLVHATGPASTFSFEMFFARDAARTPVLVRVPLSLGAFTMELAR
jgi:hypothetical protein